MTDQEIPKDKRGLKFLLILIMVAGGLFLARFAIGVGTGALHFRNTLGFEEFIASHPVQVEDIMERLPPGEPIATQNPWATGSIDPVSLVPNEGEYERADLTLLIHITRGSENLLGFREEFSVALRRTDWTHHGVHIEVKSMEAAPGLRAIAVTSISNPNEMVGENSMGKGGAVVDLFLVSGDGKNETVFQLYPSGNTWNVGRSLSSRKLSIPYWRLITGITHNVKPLPSEGLIHHVRQRVTFDWKKYEGGYGGPSSGVFEHIVNTDEYSHGIKVRIEGRMDGEPHGNSEMTKDLRRTWNGKVW